MERAMQGTKAALATAIYAKRNAERERDELRQELSVAQNLLQHHQDLGANTVMGWRWAALALVALVVVGFCCGMAWGHWHG